MAKRGVGGGAGGGPRTSTQPLVSWATAVPTKEAARRRERMLTPQNDEVLARGHKREAAPSPESLLGCVCGVCSLVWSFNRELATVQVSYRMRA